MTLNEYKKELEYLESIQEDIRGSYERVTVCAKCGEEL